ncbi:SGNH/GDSL hydrolase family protein [Rhodococcoides fascians]|uniref:SGNH/GDSL hydrolase family protein n=1 Tax=Rhodococcoides fascians TaxID=1828 RepID=UPI0037A82465
MAQRKGRRNWWAISGATVVVATVAFFGIAVVTAATRETPSSDLNYTPPPPANFDFMEASFLGDSYTAGIGAGSGASYAVNAARRLCLNSTTSGNSGSGYIEKGRGNAEFSDPARIDDVVEYNPAVIVVQGSTNDPGDGRVYDAARTLYGTLQQRAPQARIVVVGPTQPASVEESRVNSVRDSLRRATAEAGLTFIDPVAEGWLDPATDYGDDALHPTAAGHRKMGDRLVDDLRSLNIPGLTTSCDPITPTS